MAGSFRDGRLRADPIQRTSEALARFCDLARRHEVDTILCPTLSLMGIDRSGGPTVEQALRESGVGKGDRVGVVGWKTLLPEEWSGNFAPIFAFNSVRQQRRESAAMNMRMPLCRLESHISPGAGKSATICTNCTASHAMTSRRAKTPCCATAES